MEAFASPHETATCAFFEFDVPFNSVTSASVLHLTHADTVKVDDPEGRDGINGVDKYDPFDKTSAELGKVVTFEKYVIPLEFDIVVEKMDNPSSCDPEKKKVVSVGPLFILAG